MRRKAVLTPAKCGGSCSNPPQTSTPCNEFCKNDGVFEKGICNCMWGYEGSCCQDKIENDFGEFGSGESRGRGGAGGGGGGREGSG